MLLVVTMKIKQKVLTERLVQETDQVFSSPLVKTIACQVMFQEVLQWVWYRRATNINSSREINRFTIYKIEWYTEC